jgi:hypothetical protein
MMNRRNVLLAGLGAAAGALAAAAVTRVGHGQAPAGKASDHPPGVRSRRPAFDSRSLEPKGSWYEVEAADTLDLAEHARLAINALTGHLEPEKHYAVYQGFTFDKEPKLGGLTWNLPAKDARVLPMLRAMTGSTQNLDVECGLMRALLGQLGADGLAYNVGPRWWEHTAELPQYVLHMRGNTCVKVEFPNRRKFTQAEPVYPVFQRDGFGTGPTPMKKTVRYVATKRVPW